MSQSDVKSEGLGTSNESEPSLTDTTSISQKGPSIFAKLKEEAANKAEVVMSPTAWLELAPSDPGVYANAADRITKAFGKPDKITPDMMSNQERVALSNQTVLRYHPFSNLYDKEGVISNIAAYIESGASGILVLRGPVGSGKTEIATELEKLTEKEPMYVLKCKKTGQTSPFNDHPLCLVSSGGMLSVARDDYGIPERYLKEIKSAWVTKRLDAAAGNVDEAFDVVKLYPSREKQIGIAKLDPKDKQSPDINALIGEKDFNKIGEEDPLNDEITMSAGDPDAYIQGAFSKSHQGLFHGAEFLRNNPAMLNTFLEPVTEGYFTGDAGIGMLPMNQLIVITTNDPVWQEVLKKADSDAFHNRVHIVDVGYTLRMSEEIKIYDKLLKKNGLESKPMAPETLDLLAEFAVVTRLHDGLDSALKAYDPHVRAKVLNGEKVDGAEKKIPKVHELKAKASKGEGLDGFSIRDAERVMKACFNARAHEGIKEADRLLMIEVLRDFIKKADEKTIPASLVDKYTEALETIEDRTKTEIQKVVNTALIDADEGVCQTQFDKYLEYAQAYLDDETLHYMGEEINKAAIRKYLEGMEKKAGITQPEEFRHTVVSAVAREEARIGRLNKGKPPEEQQEILVKWDTYEPLAKVIRAQHEADLETRRHIIKAKSEADLRTEEERRQYTRFYENLHKDGYTDTMVNRMLMELM